MSGLRGGRINFEKGKINKRNVRSGGGQEVMRGDVLAREGVKTQNPKKPPEITGSPGPKDILN